MGQESPSFFSCLNGWYPSCCCIVILLYLFPYLPDHCCLQLRFSIVQLKYTYIFCFRLIFTLHLIYRHFNLKVSAPTQAITLLPDYIVSMETEVLFSCMDPQESSVDWVKNSFLFQGKYHIDPNPQDLEQCGYFEIFAIIRYYVLWHRNHSIHILYF